MPSEDAWRIACSVFLDRGVRNAPASQAQPTSVTAPGKRFLWLPERKEWSNKGLLSPAVPGARVDSCCRPGFSTANLYQQDARRQKTRFDFQKAGPISP